MMVMMMIMMIMNCAFHSQHTFIVYINLSYYCSNTVRKNMVIFKSTTLWKFNHVINTKYVEKDVNFIYKISIHFTELLYIYNVITFLWFGWPENDHIGSKHVAKTVWSINNKVVLNVLDSLQLDTVCYNTSQVWNPAVTSYGDSWLQHQQE
jgi:hypothetical protein